MRKLLLFVILSLIYKFSYCQDPYIMDGAGEGLGQYGYIEKDALTFARLNRNNYTNVQDLGARWWVNQEYVYWTENGSEWNGGWNCNSNDGITNKTTSNFSPNNFGSNWQIGVDVYVSVWAKWCTGGQSHSSGTGYNERHFEVVDFNNSPTTQATTASNNGTNYVVGSFVICKQNTNVTNLRRLFFTNAGTALEGSDIANDAFKVYYENSTGSETFNGDETLQGTLLGSNSGSSSDNVYGSDNINVPLGTNCVRIYIIYNSTQPFTNGRTIQLEIINDGLSLTPGWDNHDLLRINQTPITSGFVVLPVELLSFYLKTNNKSVDLIWSTASETNNDGFDIERSADGSDWKSIGFVKGRGNSTEEVKYTWTDTEPLPATSYYRLRQVDFDGGSSRTEARKVHFSTLHRTEIHPNPTSGNVAITVNEPCHMKLYDAAGRLVITADATPGSNNLEISHLAAGTYTMRIGSPHDVQVFRLIKN